MSRATARATLVALGVLLAMTVAAAAVGVLFSSDRDGPTTTLASVIGGLAFAAVGALIVMKHRRNLLATMQPAHASLWLRTSEQTS